MSTVSDAVEKNKREEEEKKSKTLNLDKPPEVDVPRDWTRLRRRLYLVIFLLLLVFGAISAGYLYREEIGDFIVSVIPRYSKGGDGEVKNRVATLEREEPVDVDPSQKNVDDGPGEESDSGKETGVRENEGPGDGGTEEEEFPEFKFSIFLDPLEPMVLIDGHWLKTGDKYNDVEVVEILRDRVRFRYKGKEKTILSR